MGDITCSAIGLLAATVTAGGQVYGGVAGWFAREGDFDRGTGIPAPVATVTVATLTLGAPVTVIPGGPEKSKRFPPK